MWGNMQGLMVDPPASLAAQREKVPLEVMMSPHRDSRARSDPVAWAGETIADLRKDHYNTFILYNILSGSEEAQYLLITTFLSLWKCFSPHTLSSET